MRWLVAVSALVVAACDPNAGTAAEVAGTDTDAVGDGSDDGIGVDDDGGTAGPSSTSDAGDGSTDGDDGPGVGSGDDDADDDSSTGDPPAADTVPVVVSVAHGGQTAMSCDRGRTWLDFHDFGPQDDHSDYAAFGGITFGNGAFVAATGWGAPGHVLRSTDGVNWEDLPDAAFINERGAVERPNSAAGVEFTGDRFLMFSGGIWESDDGLSWRRNTPESFVLGGHLREIEYLAEPDLLLIAVETDSAFEIEISADGGMTWAIGTGVTTACVGWIQHVGGFAHHDGRLMIGGGDGPTCISDDAGLTWSVGPDSEMSISDLKSDADGFVVVGEDGTVKHSADGSGWTTVGNTGLDGGRVGWHATTGYIGADVGYRYADTLDTWAAATATVPDGFGGIREFAFGTIAPTANCRLP